MVRFLEIQGPNCCEILHTYHQSKITLVFFSEKRKKEHLKEKAHLQPGNQVFPISPMATVLNWVLLANL